MANIKVSPDVIEGLVKAVLRNGFDDATDTPQFHRDLWELLCDPSPYVAGAAPRGHAKTTAGTLAYGLAKLLFRESRYCLIISDTEGQAEQFVGNFRHELQTNDALIELFGVRKNDKGEVQFLKDTNTDIVVEFDDGHTFRIIAKGAEQKLRGLNWNGTRPDLVLCDDLENDESVLNKERREKLRRWFYSALMPSLSKGGVIRVLGTILHMDSLLESFMPRLADKYTATRGLKQYSLQRRTWKAIRWRAHNQEFTEFLWPERFGKEWFHSKYMDFFDQGLMDVYSQEYLNVPLDENNTYFKRNTLQPMTPAHREKRLNYYVTVDLAISQEDRADYSVFLVAGVDQEKRLYVVNVVRERLDGKEIVDSLLYLQRMYDPVAIGIEKMQVSKSIDPFLREAMIKENTFINLVELKNMGLDKPARARTIQARLRTMTVYFDKEAEWYPTFEDEVMTFPKAKHDDQVDALAYLGKMLMMLVEANTDLEEADEAYAEETQTYGDEGRNSYTGY